MTIYEIHNQRQLLKKANKAKYEPTYDWRPKRCDDYQVPDLYIPEVRNQEQQRRMLSKVYAFIELHKQLRLSDACTIMPIPVTNKKILDICGSKMSASRLIRYMENIGLISPEDTTYQFGAYYEEHNKSRTYRYYVENEKQLLKIFTEMGIDRLQDNYIPSNCSYIDIDYFDKSSIEFSSNVQGILKPTDWSKTEFENNLRNGLADNYPELSLYQAKATEINNTYYSNYPKFQIQFKPQMVWNKSTKNPRVTKIGIRATNEYCNCKNPPKDGEEINPKYHGTYKQDILEQYNLNLHYDVKSSVPRLSYSLNYGYWLDEDIDVYQAIEDTYLYMRQVEGEEVDVETICNTLNIISRDAVKDLFMVAYFDNKSIASMGNHTCHSMLNISHQQRKEVYHEMELLQQATRYVLGDTNYGSEIFYHESCIYLDVLEELLKRGYFVWQVYDAWYARKAGVTQNAFELEVKQLVSEKATDYINRYYTK